MDTRDLYPHEILQDAINKSRAKSNFSVKMLLILSFLGGGYVGFGYLAFLKVVSGIPAEWGGLAPLLGACVFPICLICILIGGGELATGNYDADDGRTHDQIGQHEKIGTQLGFGQYRQSGRRAVYGVFLGTLCRFG